MEQSTTGKASEQITIDKIVRKNLIRFRKEMRWSKAKLAQETGIDLARYKDFEAGKAELLLSDIDLLMKGLSFHFVDLFEGYLEFSERKAYLERALLKVEDHKKTAAKEEQRKPAFTLLAGGKTAQVTIEKNRSVPFLRLVKPERSA